MSGLGKKLLQGSLAVTDAFEQFSIIFTKNMEGSVRLGSGFAGLTIAVEAVNCCKGILLIGASLAEVAAIDLQKAFIKLFVHPEFQNRSTQNKLNIQQGITLPDS